MANTQTSTAATTGFGPMLREWRKARGASQLDLALACGLSQRHLSFLESGRSRPSRGMVLHLASALDVPLRQQNAMLLAAGFAPLYRNRGLDDPDMKAIEHALGQALRQQEPYPALVVDGAYNVLRANAALGRLMAFLLGPEVAAAAAGSRLNSVDLAMQPDGLRPFIENWAEVAAWSIRRLRAEAMVEKSGKDAAALLSRVLALPGVSDAAQAASPDGDYPPTLVVRLRKDDIRIALFSMIATMGTPLDVSLQDLRLELFFPADEASAEWLRRSAGPDASR